jgi:serine/threonine protein kinase
MQTARPNQDDDDMLPPVLPAEDFSTGVFDLSQRDDPMLGTIVAGRYTVMRLLGSGGMGRVYEAFDAAEQREVAVKVLNGDRTGAAASVQRFMEEARVLSMVSHPNVVRLLDFGQDENGQVFLVMELLEGRDLGHLLAERVRLPWPETSAIAVQLVRGLAAAHQRGIVHRDLKPENVFLVAERPGAPPKVRLLDFGIAKDVQARGPRLTTDGAVFGTARYMSPEQASGNPVDARADVYGVGVLIYEMLAGRAPFPGDDFVQTAHQQISAPVPPLSEVAPEALIHPLVEELVMRALAKAKEDRYASMADFEAAIETTSIDSTMALVRYPMAPPPMAEERTVIRPPPLEAEERTVIRPPPLEAEERTVIRPPPVEAARMAVRPPQLEEERTVIMRRSSVGVAGTIVPLTQPPPRVPVHADPSAWLPAAEAYPPAPQAPQPHASPLFKTSPQLQPQFQPQAQPQFQPQRQASPQFQAPPQLQPQAPAQFRPSFQPSPQPYVPRGLAGMPIPAPMQRDPGGPFGGDAQPVFARDDNAAFMPAHLSPTRLSAPAQAGPGPNVSPEQLLATPFAARWAEDTSKAAETSWTGGETGELELRLPQRELSRNFVVAVVIISTLGLATIAFALWTMLREAPDTSVARPHRATTTEQPRPVALPPDPVRPLVIKETDPPPPDPPREAEPPPEPDPIPRDPPRPREPSGLSKPQLEAGWKKAQAGIEACGRKYGAIEGTHLQVTFDVVDSRARNTSVQPPHGTTPLGRCVATAVDTNARFVASQQPSLGVSRRVSF